MNEEIVSGEELFRSSSMDLVATIHMFIPLWAIERGQRDGRAQFVFLAQKGLNELVAGFWDGSLKVPPRLYFQSLKAVKSRFYGENQHEYEKQERKTR